MKIQVNTDNNIEGGVRFTNYVNEFISQKLDRFSNQITRVEVHLRDVNGSKDYGNDKQCLLEIRLENIQPIAVTNDAKTVEDALKGSVEKAMNALETIVGKLRNH